MAKLLVVIPDADMRGRQDALWEFARKEHGIKRQDLREGDIVAFLNAKKDRIVTLAITGEKDSVGVMSYYVSPHGRVEPHAIQFIPKSLGANGELNMTKATRMALEKLIPKKRSHAVADKEGA